jgi:hypothetical protein
VNLWLDDVRDPLVFGRRLRWLWVKTASDAIASMQTHRFQWVSLDHDLGLCDECLGADTDEKIKIVHRDGCPHNGTGYDVVCWMEEQGIWPTRKPMVHSANPVGADRMRAVIDRAYTGRSSRRRT